MNKDKPQLDHVLHSRRDAIADSWRQAIAETSYVPFETAKVRQQLVELTEQVIELLVAESFERGEARAIGLTLARLHYTRPEVLGRTQKVLMQHLGEGLSADQVVMLQPRLAALLCEVATGFSQQTHETILTEQEAIRHALVIQLRSAERALREANEQLEIRVEERTAELARTNKELQIEIAERKQAEEALRQRTAQLEALRETGLELTAQLDLNSLLHSVVSRSVELLRGTEGGLYLYQADRDVLEWTVAIGLHMAPVGNILHRGEGLSGKVWETGEPLIVDDYQHWGGRAPIYAEYPFAAVVGVPICWGKEFLGVLDVLSDTPGVFSRADADLLSLFATQAAIAIRNARLYEQTQQDAETKTTLLHEVNHRVGNNLTSLIGILNLEQERADIDPTTYRAIMADLINRVHGLATVHRMLSAAKWSSLLLSELAGRIIRLSSSSLPAGKHVLVEVSPSLVRVTPKDANNLALVINELTTNSVKYAWPERQSGHIAVCIDCQENMVRFEFRDDGVGYSEETLHLDHHSIGWDLIQKVVGRSMKGKATQHNDQGAVTVIRFPASGEGCESL